MINNKWGTKDGRSHFLVPHFLIWVFHEKRTVLKE